LLRDDDELLLPALLLRLRRDVSVPERVVSLPALLPAWSIPAELLPARSVPVAVLPPPVVVPLPALVSLLWLLPPLVPLPALVPLPVPVPLPELPDPVPP
jgi:hypothetical protein